MIVSTFVTDAVLDFLLPPWRRWSLPRFIAKDDRESSSKNPQCSRSKPPLFSGSGQRWIRTIEGVSQRIYSPPRLTTSVSTLSRRGAVCLPAEGGRRKGFAGKIARALPCQRDFSTASKRPHTTPERLLRRRCARRLRTGGRGEFFARDDGHLFQQDALDGIVIRVGGAV